MHSGSATYFNTSYLLLSQTESRITLSTIRCILGCRLHESKMKTGHSHFLWDAKLHHNHCLATKFFSILNLHGGYIYVWAELKPDEFHWQTSRGPKTIRSSPDQTHSNFLWNAKLPYNHCWETIFFSILNLHGGYIYVWAGLKPDWFHWQASRGPITIRSSPAQTHSHFLWNAKLPYNHCWETIFFSILRGRWISQ